MPKVLALSRSAFALSLDEINDLIELAKLATGSLAAFLTKSVYLRQGVFEKACNQDAKVTAPVRLQFEILRTCLGSPLDQ